MSLWGATAGAGMFAGPLAGGVLVDRLGWQWIFLINVPIGIAGFVLGVLLIPNLPGRRHPLDLFGVLLSGAGIGMVVFGLQEGQNHEWAWWIWGAIVTGLGLLVGFVGWQAAQRREPLIPLMLFRHRDFGLSNAGIALVSFAFVAFAVPLMFYLQEVCGLSPTRSALLTAPMAVATAVLAPLVGWMVDRAHPRPIVGFGFAMLTLGLIWLSLEMTPTTPVWRLLLPLTLIGAAGAFTWEPLAVIASRTLPPDLAGAGSAVYNAVRQVGAVLSSASVAALMTWLLGAEPPDRAAPAVPDALKDPFADAMSQSMLLPAFAAALGATTALFLFGRPQPAAGATATRYRSARDMRVAL
jgi:MFS family permease